jgi:molecular chaperone GrpE (heat shock protein)
VLPNNETRLDKSKGASAVASELETKMGSMFETKQSGGKVNVHEHPRRYIKEIKDNRKKLYEKEMEIIRSIRNFNNSHTRTHNHLHNSNKYHTRKFRRAIMK